LAAFGAAWRIGAAGRLPCESCKQRGPGLGEPNKRPALVKFKPALLDREIEPGAVFRKHRLVAEQKRAIDHLNVDAAILDLLEGLCMFEQNGARPWRDRLYGRASVYSSAQNHVFDFAENGTTWPMRSCQFGTIFTDPAPCRRQSLGGLHA